MLEWENVKLKVEFPISIVFGSVTGDFESFQHSSDGNFFVNAQEIFGNFRLLYA